MNEISSEVIFEQDKQRISQLPYERVFERLSKGVTQTDLNFLKVKLSNPTEDDYKEALQDIQAKATLKKFFAWSLLLGSFVFAAYFFNLQLTKNISELNNLAPALKLLVDKSFSIISALIGILLFLLLTIPTKNEKAQKNIRLTRKMRNEKEVSDEETFDLLYKKRQREFEMKLRNILNIYHEHHARYQCKQSHDNLATKKDLILTKSFEKFYIIEPTGSIVGSFSLEEVETLIRFLRHVFARDLKKEDYLKVQFKKGYSLFFEKSKESEIISFLKSIDSQAFEKIKQTSEIDFKIDVYNKVPDTGCFVFYSEDTKKFYFTGKPQMFGSARVEAEILASQIVSLQVITKISSTTTTTGHTTGKTTAGDGIIGNVLLGGFFFGAVGAVVASNATGKNIRTTTTSTSTHIDTLMDVSLSIGLSDIQRPVYNFSFGKDPELAKQWAIRMLTVGNQNREINPATISVSENVIRV